MARPSKTTSRLGAERVRQHLQGRFNPIRGLTPQSLSGHLDNFDLGYLRQTSVLWQKIRDRDDTVKSVVEKRELSAALLDWEILTQDESPEAKRHQEALEAFYNGLSATHALDKHQRGGVSKLVQQMMHAQGHRWAVHEIVWDTQADDLTAELRFTPLQFFEATAGELRFLDQDFAIYGTPLEDAGWMVTAGAGLMEATSIAYLFKQLPLRDWLVFCEKAGIPALHGKTSAAKGSKEWDDFRDALANFGVDWALVTDSNTAVEPVDLKTSGQLPHPALVDRMDRAIARLWRGADLGTMSQGGSAVGSNPQDSETDIFEAADAMLISETLQYYLDRWVIRYRFGAEPLAYFQLKPRVRINQELELKIDDALIKWGVPRGRRELAERYGRPEISADDEPASAPKPPSAGAARSEQAPAADQHSSGPTGPERDRSGSASAPPGPETQNSKPETDPPSADLANEAARNRGRDTLFRAAALHDVAAGLQQDLAPVTDRLAAMVALEDPAAYRTAWLQFNADLPALQRRVLTQSPAAAEALAQAIGTAMASGLGTAQQDRKAAARSAQPDRAAPRQTVPQETARDGSPPTKPKK